MKTIGDRIKKLRQMSAATQNVFAVPIGISQSQLAKIEAGQVEPSDDLLKSILKAYDVNEGWLMSGEGPVSNTARAATVDYNLKDELDLIAKQIILNTLQLAVSRVTLLKSYFNEVRTNLVEPGASKTLTDADVERERKKLEGVMMDFIQTVGFFFEEGRGKKQRKK